MIHQEEEYFERHRRFFVGALSREDLNKLAELQLSPEWAGSVSEEISKRDKQELEEVLPKFEPENKKNKGKRL